MTVSAVPAATAVPAAAPMAAPPRAWSFLLFLSERMPTRAPSAAPPPMNLALRSPLGVPVTAWVSLSTPLSPMAVTLMASTPLPLLRRPAGTLWLTTPFTAVPAAQTVVPFTTTGSARVPLQLSPACCLSVARPSASFTEKAVSVGTVTETAFTSLAEAS